MKTNQNSGERLTMEYGRFTKIQQLELTGGENFG